MSNRKTRFVRRFAWQSPRRSDWQVVETDTMKEAAHRQLTTLRAVLTRKRTAVINGAHKILRKHNVEQEQPTKKFQTKKVHEWLRDERTLV